MTIMLFEKDPYLIQCEATVRSITEHGGIILDQTVFYPTGGGQPGDSGELQIGNTTFSITTTVKDRASGHIVHVPHENQPIAEIGTKVTAKINWPQRHIYMRMHTALHLLCSVIPCRVTGGQIGVEKSRLDFNTEGLTLDKHLIESSLNQLIQENHAISVSWISNDELAQKPHLIKTMSVKPPKTQDSVRLLKIGDTIDLQPCGGTHVNSTQEIGPVIVSKIENKGKQNRRVNIKFATDQNNDK